MTSSQSQSTYNPCLTDPDECRDHIILTLKLQPNGGVIDLTNHIDRGEYVAGGTFGQVHEGRWKGVDESIVQILPRVAVKVIPLPRPRSQNERNERYKIMQRERKVWSRINHDNILPLIAFAHINGDPNLPAFISPWIRNGTVMEYLKDNPHSSPYRFLEDIINGLFYLHTFNPEIVHGDIKSANVLVNDGKRACLCDFGLSRFTADNTLYRTSATSAPGTMRWMAPELLNGDVSTVTREADIYAYGMTCWEILAGQIPFQSIKDLNVAPRVIAGERPERILERHPDKIWQIIIKCWMNDSSNRPTTTAVLLSVEGAVASIASKNANANVNPDVLTGESQVSRNHAPPPIQGDTMSSWMPTSLPILDAAGFCPPEDSSSDESFLDALTPKHTGRGTGRNGPSQPIPRRPRFFWYITEPEPTQAGVLNHMSEPADEYCSREPSPLQYVDVDGVAKDSTFLPAPQTTKHDQIRFDIKTPTYGDLTHLSPHSVFYRDRLYPSAAHLFEAHKYLGGAHDLLAKRVRHASNLAELNALASSFRKYVREDWAAVELDKMKDVLYRKFIQHPKLSDLLLGTGMAVLIYAEVADDFWGSGPDGRGANQLGLALMRIRDRLRRARR